VCQPRYPGQHGLKSVCGFEFKGGTARDRIDHATAGELHLRVADHVDFTAHRRWRSLAECGARWGDKTADNKPAAVAEAGSGQRARGIKIVAHRKIARVGEHATDRET